ncbi:MAG: TetR/AcrR family transcriptional regulator [Pseudomonadota bacterium]
MAETIVRSRGYNAFSYADIAAEVGTSKASLHHHFSTKSDLGLQLVTRFTNNVLQALEQIDTVHSSALIKLREYARLYEGAMEENQMCLCGMLAAEHETLSDAMQTAINDFFDGHERWLEQVLLKGRETGELAFDGEASVHAQAIVSSFQGALLVAKSQRSMRRMKLVSSHLVENYRATQP